MHLKSLALGNFRNFSQVEEVAFSPATLLVAAAPNATGKTNFLEALTVLLRAKSFRGSLEDCVQWGEESFVVQGMAEHRKGPARLAVSYHTASRKLRVEEDGVPTSPVTFFARYPFVLFLPEDTFLFNRGPAQRRTFLNHILVSAPAYVSSLVQYHRVLKQRNASLKTAASPQAIEAWTSLLIENSSGVWNQRASFAQFIASHLDELYEKISGEKREFKIRLATTSTDPVQYRQLLVDSFAQEKRYGYTLFGPHRDDLEVTSEGRPIATALSRGQMRSVVIALKLAAARYITQTTQEEPLLLLDEVLSELDDARQAALLTHLPQSQILLTCTAVPKILRTQDNVHLLDLRSILAPSRVAQSQATPAIVPERAAVAG